jgi:hypothetical protein
MAMSEILFRRLREHDSIGGDRDHRDDQDDGDDPCAAPSDGKMANDRRLVIYALISVILAIKTPVQIISWSHYESLKFPLDN